MFFAFAAFSHQPIPHSSGSTITAEIQGVIDACVKLTGMPDLTLSFMVSSLFSTVLTNVQALFIYSFIYTFIYISPWIQTIRLTLKYIHASKILRVSNGTAAVCSHRCLDPLRLHRFFVCLFFGKLEQFFAVAKMF